MKIIATILSLIASFAYIGAFAATDSPLVAAPLSNSGVLQAAQNQLDNSIHQLEDVKEKEKLSPEEKERAELEASKKALSGVIEFSIAETENVIAKLRTLGNLNNNYAELRDSYLAILSDLRDFQQNYLLKLEDVNLKLAEVKKLATLFKNWRSDVYDPSLRDVLNFLLVLQGNDALTIAGNRHAKISSDLNLLKKSKIVKVEVLRPLLEDAGTLLNDAKILSDKANASLFDASSTPAQISSAANSVLSKIKQAYSKFLEMSALVKKMLGR